MPKKEAIPEVSLNDIITKVDKIHIERHPNIESYLGIDKYFESLVEAATIIRRYKEGDSAYEYARMKEDLLILSAIHVSTAECVGYLQGYSRRAEDARKIAKSKYALGIRGVKDEVEKDQKLFVKATDPDIDNASRVMSKEFYLEAADAEILSNMAKSMWYSIQDFIMVLNSSINRSHQELMQSSKS